MSIRYFVVMTMIKLNETDLQLAELVNRVEAGEEIVIARGDKPVAVLKSYDLDETARLDEIARKRKAGMGSLAGKISVPPDDSWWQPMSAEELREVFGDAFE